jgi:SAM-dependent methyltransferase
MKQGDIDSKNNSFWSTPCGTNAATALGLSDRSPKALERYDEWFFSFYPYLLEMIEINKVHREDVLEIGLGYGSVAAKLMSESKSYSALDIAEGAIELIKYRGTLSLRDSDIRHGSILSPPWGDASFDRIVAIGCLHHTGDFDLAVQNCFRLLKPGGTLVFMVYNALSYRQLKNINIVDFLYRLIFY